MADHDPSVVVYVSNNDGSGSIQANVGTAEDVITLIRRYHPELAGEVFRSVSKMLKSMDEPVPSEMYETDYEELRYQTASGQERYWKVRQQGSSYEIESGVVGTKNPRVTPKEVKASGKEGSRYQRTAEHNCLIEVERLISRKAADLGVERALPERAERNAGTPAKQTSDAPEANKAKASVAGKKKDGGAKPKRPKRITSEAKDFAKVQTRARKIDWGPTMQEGFTAPKPKTKISEDDHREIAKPTEDYPDGKALYPKKYDGVGAIARCSEDGWRIYTLDNQDITGALPKIVEDLEQNENFGPGTMLHGEIAEFFDGPGLGDDRGKASGYLFASDETRAEGLASGRYVEPTLVVFDTLFMNGTDMGAFNHDQRAEHYEPHLPLATEKMGCVVRAEYYEGITPDNWEEHTKKLGIEGLILIDRSVAPGTVWSINNSNNNKRPPGKWKLKPAIDEDVVMYAVHAKADGTPRSVFVKQIDPSTGEWFMAGKIPVSNRGAVIEGLKPYLGTDLPVIATDSDLKDSQIAKRLKTEHDVEIADITGVVVGVIASDRFKSGKFDAPKFDTDKDGDKETLRLRTDKQPENCIAAELPEDQELKLVFIK